MGIAARSSVRMDESAPAYRPKVVRTASQMSPSPISFRLFHRAIEDERRESSPRLLFHAPKNFAFGAQASSPNFEQSGYNAALPSMHQSLSDCSLLRCGTVQERARARAGELGLP